MSDDRLYLLHILERCERIEEFTHEGREAFSQLSLIQDAVIRNFEVIGEAAKQVSPNLREAHPEIPWRRVAGFRDVLIHNYLGVDLDEVWNVVEHELPGLKHAVTTILDGIEQDPS